MTCKNKIAVDDGDATTSTDRATPWASTQRDGCHSRGWLWGGNPSNACRGEAQWPVHASSRKNEGPLSEKDLPPFIQNICADAHQILARLSKEFPRSCSFEEEGAGQCGLPSTRDAWCRDVDVPSFTSTRGPYRGTHARPSNHVFVANPISLDCAGDATVHLSPPTRRVA